jgi:hypothetical protein
VRPGSLRESRPAPAGRGRCGPRGRGQRFQRGISKQCAIAMWRDPPSPADASRCSNRCTDATVPARPPSDEYDGSEYGGLPVNCRISPTMLCAKRFRVNRSSSNLLLSRSLLSLAGGVPSQKLCPEALLPPAPMRAFSLDVHPYNSHFHVSTPREAKRFVVVRVGPPSPGGGQGLAQLPQWARRVRGP